MQCLRTLLAAIAILVGLIAVGSAQGPRTSAPSGPVLQPNGEATYLKITLDVSRSPIAMDTEAGLSAEIKNVSQVPVKLFERETVFVTMPETRIYGGSPHVVMGCATFPTQGNPRSVSSDDNGATSSQREVPAGDVNKGGNQELLIQPGDSYRVFWDMSMNGCTGALHVKLRFWSDPIGWLEEKWQRIAFQPGVYKIYMDVVAYPQDPKDPAGTLPYRSVTEARETQVSASQQMVLLGAFLGGVLAYIIKWYYGVNTPLVPQMGNQIVRRFIGWTEWLSAGLFGAAMAILASRLSDTFPVKVSADDFWGAITLGFVFQWIGVKLLEKLPGMGPSNVPARVEPPKPPDSPESDTSATTASAAPAT